MNKIRQRAIYILLILGGILGCLGFYARMWEVMQAEKYFSEATIQSIEQYSYRNELHWSSRGYRVYIVGENKPIDFPLKNWDNTVNVGDAVDLIVRSSFPWFGLKNELDGLSINHHE
jgi:hypothetical protein